MIKLSPSRKLQPALKIFFCILTIGICTIPHISIASATQNSPINITNNIPKITASPIAKSQSLTTSLTTFAELESNYTNIFSQNDILFYDPNECEATTTSTGSCTTVSGDQITWIGDSYSVGAEQDGNLITSAYPGVDLGPSINDASSNIMVSKAFGGSNGSNPTGVQILENLKNSGKLRSVVVFALGTNDMAGGVASQSSAQQKINKVLEIIGSDTKIVFVNGETGNGNDYSGFNAALEETKSAHPDQVFVADWAGVADSDTFSADPSKIHPNGHYDIWLNAIKSAMPKSCSGGAGLLSGDGPAAIIWNHIAENYAAQYNFTPEIIAAIVGNLELESSFNPFIGTGSYRGLFQSNDPGFISFINGKFGNHWGQKVSADVAEEAMKAEIDYLMDPQYGFNFNGSKFKDQLDVPTKKTGEDGAAAYSDLFLVTVERAFGSPMPQPLEDPGVQKLTKYTVYQAAGLRREYARKYYQQYLQGGGAGTVTSVSVTGGSGSSISSGTGTTNSGSFTWQDGWLTGGMPGYEKEDVSNMKLSETIKPGYGTPDGKPNKIVLHSTEGTTLGFTAYPTGHKFPAHFMIDMKKKQVVQNLPITNRALATSASDASSVQIEIVGFSTPSFIPNKSYYLQDFGDEEWDYLALLLAAISQETGIPLTTEMDWNINYSNSGGVRQSNKENFNNNVKGIVGHMHSPAPDTHIDPGPIWTFLEKAFARNPSAGAFANTSTSTGSCDTCSNIGASGGYVNGGLTEAQAEQMAAYYKSDKVSTSEWNLPSTAGKWNCVSFSAWFVQAFTTFGKGPNKWTLDGGGRSFAPKIAKEKNLPESTTPKPFSVFSVTRGKTMCSDGQLCGHTGIVVAVNGDDITTIEAAYGNVGYTAVKHRDLSYFVNTKYTNTFADLSPILDMNKLQEFFNGEAIAVSSSGGSMTNSCGPATTATPTGDDGAPCDPRTIDLGVTEDAYFSGENKPIRLCAIPNINQAHATNADWADQFVKSGADTTHIHVNTRVSGSFYELGQKYMDSHGGNMLTASESYRTMARQEYFWNCYQCKCCNNGNLAGRPGKSNHQGGLAVDFRGEYNWLGQNVESVGLKQGISIGEPWHISLSGR